MCHGCETLENVLFHAPACETWTTAVDMNCQEASDCRQASASRPKRHNRVIEISSSMSAVSDHSYDMETGASRPFTACNMGATELADAPKVLMPVGARVGLCQGAACKQHVNLNTCSSRRRMHAEGVICGMHLRKRLGRSALVRVFLHGPLQVCMSARHALHLAFICYAHAMLIEMDAHESLHVLTGPTTFTSLYKKLP